MRAHRFWTLSLVVALAACTNDNPTGLSHVEGNQVDNIRLFQLQRLLIADETLQCETMDFNGLPSNSLNPGPISILGENVSVEILDGWVNSSSDCGTGDVLVFDTGVASSVDNDLVIAGNSAGLTLRNVLSHQSCETDGVPNNDPNGGDAGDNTFIANDADVMATMKFSFVSGDWTIKNFAALDQEKEEGIALFTDGFASNTTNAAVNFADSVEIVVVDVNATFSSMLEFKFNGSGAIDDLEICRMAVDRGGEGCTPGYWKQSQHFDSWPAADTTIRFDEAFVAACVFDAALQKPESGDLCDLTLLEALNLKGGGANALGRHAAAAWLNTQSVDFHYLQDEVQDNVAAALEAGLLTGTYEITKDALAAANEAGCPLN